jgi:Cysteine dioxygenase type I
VTQGSAIDQRILSPAELAAQVRRLTASPAEWVTRVRLDAEGRWYERIQAGDGWEVWLISWLPGQSTGFHDHGSSAGAFGVVWGALDEWVPAGGTGGRGAPPFRGVPGASSPRGNSVKPGQVRAFGPHYVHDVRNGEDSSVAVSVHAYSPPLSSMTSYDLTPNGLVRARTEGADDW